MKVTMQLTLDGLVRAMRTRAHDLAEAIENGRAEEVRGPSGRDALERRTDTGTGGTHDRRDA